MTGLPVERMTIVGTLVLVMAFIREVCAPTRRRLFTSTCSPVLLVVSYGRVWVRRYMVMNGWMDEHVRCVEPGPELVLVPRPSAHDDNCYV